MKSIIGMGKVPKLLILPMFITLVTACGQRKQIEIIDFDHYSAYDVLETLEEQG